jgi:uncharacterized protein
VPFVHPEASQLIAALGLRPHPEGGYFTESYRSDARVNCSAGNRSALTSIYFLLTGDSFSAFHRLTSDEVWHHYAGGIVAIETIGADRRYRQLVIGDGATWQAAFPAGIWFAAHVVDPDGYALIGCDVAPGFEYSDFEIGSRAELLGTFPEHASLIERWTRLSV